MEFDQVLEEERNNAIPGSGKTSTQAKGEEERKGQEEGVRLSSSECRQYF